MLVVQHKRQWSSVRRWSISHRRRHLSGLMVDFALRGASFGQEESRACSSQTTEQSPESQVILGASHLAAEAEAVIRPNPELVTAMSAERPDGGDQGADHVEHLRHIISEACMALAPHNVEAALKAPKPHNNELQSNLGLINFYWSFLPNLLGYLQLLHLVLRDGQHWA
ncbi:hypothetical protein HPB50_005056 [Hyalomma asiaticum]|uniref:Uncharacterized protein n=1 Tax=Hyalomma asiaticum TaxID=266040 RepID=A0ACB7SRK4_HYAAI|nr:hypothetical protein HPB50_005056 [Hyalomma asiaticum]